MKSLLPLFVLFYSTISAQYSCCTMSVNDKNNLLAMNESFASTHLAPEPFKLENPKGSMITYKTPDGKTAHAYMVKSDKQSNKVLFVFHEWWGLNDYIKREADNFAKELGNVTVYALDLYDGEVATTTPEAQKLMGAMKEERTKAIIQGAIQYVGADKKIASIGWCMGGAWSLQSALLEGKQAIACVMYYGMPEQDVKKLETLNCDVLGFFGTQDNFINPTVVKTFEENMKKAGKHIKTTSYDAVHAFANPSNPKYNKTAADDAHTKAITYLKERLR